MIPFAAHSVEETPDAFQWVEQPPRLPLSVVNNNNTTDNANSAVILRELTKPTRVCYEFRY